MTANPSRVTVLGAGYVGLTTAVALAHLGHRVTCADVDRGRVAVFARWWGSDRRGGHG